MEKTFASWKVYVAILLGLSIVSWMLYRSVQQTHFIESKHQGNYCWVDINHNQHVDFTNEKEFVLCKSGDYKKENVVGKEYVDEIVLFDIINNKSSSLVINKIKNQNQK